MRIDNRTMLNKVVVFVIFGPKCIFDASKIHMDYFDDVFISFLDKDSIPRIHFQWRDRKFWD